MTSQILTFLWIADCHIVRTFKTANANKYWTKAMEPVYVDLNVTGIVVEANFLIQPKLIETTLEGYNTWCVHHVSRQRIPFKQL